MNERPDPEKIDETIPVEVHLGRIARELKTIRELATVAVTYLRGAESEVPEYMRRFMDYMHDISDVRYMYESLGHQAPGYVKDEAARCDDRLRQLLKKLHSAGEAFEKVRREMAEDPDNRWDHTRQLTFIPDHKQQGK